MVHRQRNNLGLHSRCCEPLRLGRHHEVFFSDKKPSRLFSPSRIGHRFPETLQGNRLLSRLHTAVSDADASGAKALRKASTVSQRNPSASGCSFGALGWGGTRRNTSPTVSPSSGTIAAM